MIHLRKICALFTDSDQTVRRSHVSLATVKRDTIFRMDLSPLATESQCMIEANADMYKLFESRCSCF